MTDVYREYFYAHRAAVAARMERKLKRNAYEVGCRCSTGEEYARLLSEERQSIDAHEAAEKRYADALVAVQGSEK